MAKRKGQRNNQNKRRNVAPQGSRPAPQAAPHRRGGTHRVKPEHKTNTVYDEWDYKQLKTECIERSVYIKDMKKVMMAKALANFDMDKKRAERAAVLDRENLQRLQAIEKQRENNRRLKAEAAKHRRRIEKQARRDRDEDVSDDTPDEEELEKMHNELLGLDADGADQGPAGQALSEESWDSTSSESTVQSRAPSVHPECRLRLFEWPYAAMPSTAAPVSHRQAKLEQTPCHISYLSLKIHTTESKEKLFLPGQTYPPGVDPDYVPVLLQQTRHAARNGVLEGVLRKATIEPASAWTDRTRIQGWNARMFFSLPPRNVTKNLPDVYNKWYLENRRLLRVKPLGDGEKVNRQKRHAQRHKNKAKKLAEVLEASEHRLTAVCYLAAYLDYDSDQAVMRRRQLKEERTLENLFFIRFPGCDVPHYYFRTRRGEWADPTTPNPEYDPTDIQDDDSDDHIHSQVAGKRLPSTVPRTFTRVKNSTTPPPPNSNDPIASIEHALHNHGLAHTLSHYRAKWLASGNSAAWKIFAHSLPALYPSGQLPSAPPVHPQGSACIAIKMASIEVYGQAMGSEPLRGGEAWTRDDDGGWDVVEVGVGEGEGGEDAGGQDVEPFTPTYLEALYRRDSVPGLARVDTECAKWLEQVSPSFVPLSANTLPLDSPHADTLQEEWENRFLPHEQLGMDFTCPFCSTSLAGRTSRQQAEHMFSHSAITPQRRRASSFQRPLLALSLTPVVPSLADIDPGNEADTDTPPPVSPTRRHRVSQLPFHPPSTPSSHIPSPHLPSVKRYLDDHPNAAFNPRKRSLSSVESLEFLDGYAGEGKKKRKIGEHVSATSSLTLSKRKRTPISALADEVSQERIKKRKCFGVKLSVPRRNHVVRRRRGSGDLEAEYIGDADGDGALEVDGEQGDWGC
ncbi:hypothetical protein CC86DRAFT_432851 [Ophiobolus disseminans]|uniref:Uncharacterized protein n=1 Tax=Ophiobolus disseminans TaxID=1469910 RepID=A0A6A6ZDI6_9PLEO|nr:hypothetical protein CC86DRAFT_432851 [Ophiobolus disseminans]